LANHRYLFAISAILSSFFLHSSYGADTGVPTGVPGTGVTLPNPFTFGALPPTFNSASAAGLAAKFSACLNSSGALGVLTALTSATSRGKVSGGTKLEDACTSTDGKAIGDDIGDLANINGHCELLQTDGKYDPSRLKQERDRLDQVTGLLQCKENKFKQVKSQLDCLNLQANQITQQVTSLQKTLTDSIHKMQQDAADLASQSKNRQSQIEDINVKLSGDTKGSGSAGLLAQQQKSRDLVAQMTAKIAALKEDQKKASLQRSSLVERAQQRTMGITKDCFTTQTKAEFRCYTAGTKDNPAQSAKDYLLCRYRQNQTSVSNGGVVTQNGIQAAVGNQKADQLGSLLDEIFSESPDANQTTTDPQKFQQQIDKVVTVLSVADIERIYGARLKAFDGKGIPVHDYVMKYVGSCFQKATVAVQNERARTNSSLGQAEEAIKALERQNSTVVHSYMDAIALQYGENMKALTGDHMPLDVSQCYNASPDQQARCLDEAMTSFQAQLSGVKPAANPNAPDYSMNIFIKGNDAKTDITVACVGIDGCVTKLQQYSTALNREVQKIDTFKNDYVGKAFRNTEDFVQQLRTALQPQSDALRNQLKTLNAALSTLGVDKLVKIEDMSGEDLQQDDQDPNKGLPKMPKDILAMIGAGMSPKLLNVAGNDFSDALGGIATAANDLKNKESKVLQAKLALTTAAETCRKKDLETPIAELKTKADVYAKTCVPFLCDGKDAEGSFSSLANTVGSLHIAGVTSLQDVAGILNSGSSACVSENSDWKRKVDNADQAVKDKQRQYDNTEDKDKKESILNELGDLKRKAEDARTRPKDPSNCSAIASEIQSKFGEIRNQANRSVAGDAIGAQ
jgi:hypothetical protein